MKADCGDRAAHAHTRKGKRGGYLNYMPWLLLVLAISGGVLGYGVVNGWFLLNRPRASGYPVHGVDVSHYQGEIDWPVLEDQGITFVYIKATEGSSHTDQRFKENLEEASDTGLYIGAYHFFSFDSPGESQAWHFIQTVGTGEDLLPPVVDFEFYGDKKVNPPPAGQIAKQLKAMLGILEDHYGTTPIIYATEEAYDMYLEGRFDRYPLWIRNVVRRPRIDREWMFWQYANRGRLKGYSGQERFIDLNVFNGTREQWAGFVEKSDHSLR